MTGDERLQVEIVSADDGQRAVLSPHDDRDRMQASGEWLATDTLVDVRR